MLMLRSRSDDMRKPQYIPTKISVDSLESAGWNGYTLYEEIFVLDGAWFGIFQKPINFPKVKVTFDSFWLCLPQAGMDILEEGFGVCGCHSMVGTTTDLMVFWESPAGHNLDFHEPTTPLRALM